jgi:hypothetical protein
MTDRSAVPPLSLWTDSLAHIVGGYGRRRDGVADSGVADSGVPAPARTSPPAVPRSVSSRMSRIAGSATPVRTTSWQRSACAVSHS